MLAASPFTSEDQVSPFAAAQDDGKNSARLLVIGADFQDRNTVSDALETESCELVFQDSLGPLDEHLVTSAPFNAVLIDLSHPIESCFDMLASIRRERPQTEVIFLSRLADEALWIESIQRGAYDFLPKPLDRSELRRIVTNAIEKNRLDAFRLGA